MLERTNEKLIPVMEKAGMHKDAVLRDRRINKHTGERNDAIIYSMTKEEL